jgi:Leucine-rich repeat (LRR) protein
VSLGVVGLWAPVALAGGPATLRFDSKLPLRVVALEASGERTIGTTPTEGARGLWIPAGAAWFIEPAGSTGSDGTSGGASLLEVVAEAGEKKVPGLRLCVRAAPGTQPGAAGAAGPETQPGADRGLDPEVLAAVGKLDSLRWLDLSGCRMGDREVSLVTGPSALETLRLAGDGITDDSLPLIARIAGLRTLGLESTRITDAGLEKLAVMGKLERLDVSGGGLTGHGLAAVGKMSGLRALDIGGNASLSEEHLSHLVGLKRLSDVGLGSLKLTASGLETVARHAGLKRLVLRGVDLSGPGLTFLKPLSKLERLDLSDTGLSDAQLAALAAHRGLLELRVDGTRATDLAADTVSKLTKLEVLSLARTGVTDVGLAKLAGLTSMKDLDLSGLAVTDAGMLFVARMKNLERIRLVGCNGLTDAMLPVLVKLSTLGFADLTGTRTTEVESDGLRYRFTHPVEVVR